MERLHALRLLGKIEFARNNLADAIEAWQQSLDEESTDEGARTSMRDITRKDLARALLQTRQPSKARNQLQLILAKAPDTEASWLLSRAYLQEKALPEALAALKEAGTFAEDDPTLPEPAPFVGAASCLPCHSERFQVQQQLTPCQNVPSHPRASGSRSTSGPDC